MRSLLTPPHFDGEEQRAVVEQCHFRDMEIYSSVTRRQASLDAPGTLHCVMIREEKRKTRWRQVLE